MTRATIRVYCDVPSHAPKVATVGHLEYGSAELGADGKLHAEHRDDLDVQWLDGDQLIPADPHEPGLLLSNETGDRIERPRYVYECPLCGLRVELTGENVDRLTDGLAAAGVTSVRLSDLAATL